MTHHPETYTINPYHDSARKRALDLAVGAALSVPIGTAMGVAVPMLKRSLDEGPLYFRQERVGGVITKLRTMRQPKPGEPEVPSIWDASNNEDPRVVSAWVRHTRIDEGPQVFQAIRDALAPGPRRRSIVGIRPLVAHHADDLYHIVREERPQMAEFWRYELLPNVQHGVLSMASVVHSRRTSNDGAHMDGLADDHHAGDPSEELRQRLFARSWVQHDITYNRVASVRTDLLLVVKAAGQLGLNALDMIKPTQA